MTILKPSEELKTFNQLAKEKKIKVKFNARNSKKLSLDEKLKQVKLYL